MLSRVNKKETILTGWERALLWPYNPEIAYKSSAVVETIEQLRCMRIDGGQIIYDTHALSNSFEIVNKIMRQINLKH